MHILYGTSKGIEYNLTPADYLRLTTATTPGTPPELSAAMITHFIQKANAKLDSIIIKAVGKANIPLAVVPDELHHISDDLATYFILRPIYRKVEPNKSDWVDEFFKLAMDNLKLLIENGDNFVDANGNVITVDGFDSSTLNYDPIFGMERTIDGTIVTSDYERSMEGW